MDLFKATSRENRTAVVKIINTVKKEPQYPAEFCKANIVTVFKRRSVEDPWNYGQIALLQSVYQLHASLFQNRLIAGLDHRIYASQYGF